MIGFHFQNPVNDWPRAVALLPKGTPIKAIDNVQLLDEAKRLNPNIVTVLRHFYDGRQHFGGNLEQNKIKAREFFATFVDGTFRNYAHNVDFIEDWNEYLATSQNQQEIADRVTWATAVASVWRDEYRIQSQYAHIRLCIGNVAVGNEIPTQFAIVAALYDCVIGYHPYIPVTNGTIKVNEWPDYSGRWTVMDAKFKAAGYTVKWLFTEGGPVYEYGPNQLDPGGGWKHPNVYNGNINSYVNAMKYWLDKVSVWNGLNGNRAYGVTLFTSGGGETWKWFETKQPEMDALANMVKNYKPPVPPIPQPVPDWKVEAWQLSIDKQTISLNKDSALQNAIRSDGFTPVESEFWATLSDGIQKAFMAAENLFTGERRLYYAVVPNWSSVQWFKM